MGKVISLEDWQKTKLVDWVTRFTSTRLLTMPRKQRQEVLKQLEAELARREKEGET